VRPVAREVSCLALTFFFDYLESQGLDSEQLLVGLPLSPAELRDRSRWMDYGTFLLIEGRVAALFPDRDDLFFDIGRSFASTQGFGFMRIVGRAVVSPFQVYAQIPRMVPRFLFPFVDITFERLGPDRMRGTYQFQRGFAPTPAFVETVRGILTAVPVAVGAPEAEVRVVRREALRAVFELTFHRWPGPLLWARGTLERFLALFRIRMRNLGEAAAELEETNVLLLEKVEALEEAKGVLDTKVRDLVVLNRIALAAARQRDPRELAREIVTLISKEFDGRGVAVLLRDGEQGRLVPVARRSVPLEVFGDVVRTVRRHVDRPGFVDTLLRLENFEAWVVPLAGADGVLGALFVQSEHDDRPLLESVARQLGVAFDNALAYRLVNELRSSLEIRVQERTAQLEEARQQLEATVDSLEQANQSKERFFTNVSHELKTPLTLVLGPLEQVLASAAASDPAVAAELTTARKNALALRTMVEELLDFSRLDAGRLQARIEAFDLAELIDEQVARFAPLSASEGVVLSTGELARPMSVEGDVELLRRVLSNLIGNAIKYVEEGDEVLVGGSADDVGVRVTVADSGPGILEEHADHVFERFHRAVGEDGRQVPGSGIGLAMCREIVQLHGGTITLRPTDGGGATFEMSLPAAAPGVALAPIPILSFSDSDEQLLDERQVDLPLASVSEERDRILLVEDNRDMRAFLVRLLERRWVLTVARDGQQGLELARAEPPDLVISDVMMPNMSGYELCRVLKADPVTRSVPVILVSARGGGDAALDGFAAGASDYVVKPFSPPELLARVDAQIRLRRLTRALIESEKRASLAAMSAGIAHEVLNPVNVIANSVGLLRGLAPGDDAARGQLLGLVGDASDRIQSVVEATLRLARREGAGELRDVDLGERVAGLLPLLRHRMGDVALHLDLEGLESFESDPELLDQLVMNLLSNAFDAVDSKAGEVWLSARQVDEILEIRVRDNGPGIAPEDRELVFAPFFTTKDPGEGTGLGLALCREMVAVVGGELHLGHPERGAELVATLPVGATR